MIFISVINIANFFFKYISLYIKLDLSFLFELLPIFLVKISFNSIYIFLSIFLVKVGLNSQSLLIFLSKINLYFIYKFLAIFFIFKKLLLILLFIFKYYHLLAKFLLLADFLSFSSLFLDWGLLIASFGTFRKENCMKDSISSFIP